VLATPARGDEFALDERREDLGMLVLFATAFGVLAALWSSGIAARALARPVGALREAALSLAAGNSEPELGAAPASEFAPVFRAFGRMARDLSASRAELEAAQRRTETVLQHVASAVVAFRSDGTVTLANPRADIILELPAGGVPPTLSDLPAPLADRLSTFLAGTFDEDTFEIEVKGRQLRARLTRLAGGAVLTLDDVTELASAQRVLAWGEMARQVAHEIKNPLTPIRLGVQHLRRAFRDGRGDFAAILETNVSRVLAEIDHLDEIARAFSRYGSAPENRPQPVPVDVVSVVKDVIALEQLGEDGVQWLLETENQPVPAALGIPDELKEVVLNLLENARLANATRVVIRIFEDGGIVYLEVRDDGTGIASDVMPRIFEPHFSTRTSGSGLGLAISRRLIEGWGGTIAVSSSAPEGTVVRIGLRSVSPSG
jgi:two-component system, NtrC family, nitrogen regulation sensor histidine kinase NtrY